GLQWARGGRSKDLLALGLVRAGVVLQRVCEVHLEDAGSGEGALRVSLAAGEIDDDPHAPTDFFGALPRRPGRRPVRATVRWVAVGPHLSPRTWSCCPKQASRAPVGLTDGPRVRRKPP